MEKALSGYTYVRKWGNSLVVLITKECELLGIKNGDLVKIRIQKANPEIEEKPKKKKEEAPEGDIKEETGVSD